MIQILLNSVVPEALTLFVDSCTGAGTLTRWSLVTNPVLKLTQREILLGVLWLGDGQIFPQGGNTSRYAEPRPADGPSIISSGSDLLIYQLSDGMLQQRLPPGLSEPPGGLALADDGKTLWLATQTTLVAYQLPSLKREE